MKSRLSDFIQDVLFPNLYHSLDRLLPEFELKQKTNYWQSSNKTKIDGSKGDAVGKVYIYQSIPFGIKDYTRGFISLWAYIKQRDNLTDREVLHLLAQTANVSLPELNSDYLANHTKKQEIASFWEDVFSYCRNQMFVDQSELGRLTKQYLTKERKYTVSEIKAMNLGLLTSLDDLKAHLIHENKRDWESFRYLLENIFLDQSKHEGWKRPLVIPFRNYQGMILGMSFRAIDTTIQPKYLNTTGTEKGLFNYLRTYAAGKDILVVEGQLDALICEARGLKPAIALAGSSINEEQILLLEDHKVKSLTLCLDGDKAGNDATERIIKQFLQIPKLNLKLYLVNLPEGEDPDSFLRERPAKDLHLFVEQAKRHYEYLADKISPPFELVVNAKKIDTIIDELAKIYNYLPIGDQAQFLRHIELQSITPELNANAIEKRAFEKIEAQKYSEQQRHFSQLLYEVQQKNKQNKLPEAINELRQSLNEISAIVIPEKIKLYTPDAFEKEISEAKDGLLTGYNTLDQNIRIPPGAITLIAGRTGHGKTTLMLNLLWSLSLQYPERAFYFFTLEEERKYLTLKLLNMVVDEPHLSPNNRSFLKNYIANHQQPPLPLIEHAKSLLYSRILNNQIQLVDQNLNIEALIDVITRLKIESNLPIGAIFVDYVQKIQTQKNFEIRQRQLQYVSNHLLQNLAVGQSLSLILGAQLNRDTDKSADGKPKLHHLREAGDLEQDANLALGIFNPSVRDDLNEIEAPNNESISLVPLEIKTLKNRDGAVNRTMILNYNPSTGRIYDSLPSPNAALEENTQGQVFN